MTYIIVASITPCVLCSRNIKHVMTSKSCIPPYHGMQRDLEWAIELPKEKSAQSYEQMYELFLGK
jgi:hypothetical protein